jgi:predicted nucleotidyltransferase
LIEIGPQLRGRGVSHLALFGSRAREDGRTDSDVDLLVDVDDDNGFSLLDLLEVERIVAGAVKADANAFMRRSLDPSFKASIKPDIVEVF